MMDSLDHYLFLTFSLVNSYGLRGKGKKKRDIAKTGLGRLDNKDQMIDRPAKEMYRNAFVSHTSIHFQSS